MNRELKGHPTERGQTRLGSLHNVTLLKDIDNRFSKKGMEGCFYVDWGEFSIC